MKRVELNMDALEMVIGGTAFTAGTYEYNPTLHIHKGCGGQIDNWFCWYAKCEKCGEEHWWLSDFDHYDISYLKWKELKEKK